MKLRRKLRRAGGPIKQPALPLRPASRSLHELTPPPAGSGWFFCLLLILATITAYLPVWHAGFIFDDNTCVTQNPLLYSLDGLRQIWASPGVTLQYYPLTFTVFWLEYHLWGLNPLGYHLVNVSLHAVNAILFWLILRRLGVPGAWLAAAIFALHPVCVETVAWVTEHKNTLSGVFYLSSILAALAFWLPDEVSPQPAGSDKKRPVAGQGSWKFYWLTLCLYIFALGSKTATIALPVVILLLIWWKRGRPRWRTLGLLLPFLAVGAIMGLMTMYVENRLGEDIRKWSLPAWERCLVACRGVWFYLGKLFWPHPLIFIYPRWKADTFQWSPYGLMLAAAIGVVILWWRRGTWGRPILFGLAYFLVLLLPILGFLNTFYFRYSFVADHFQYLASLGPIAVAAAGIETALGRLRKSFVGPVLYSLLLLALGALTWRQAEIYRGWQTLWPDTLAKNPGCWVAQNNLAAGLLTAGHRDEAQAHYEAALRLKPDYAEAHAGLASVFADNGKLDEAVAENTEALRLNPNLAEAYDNLGNLFSRMGKSDEAIALHRTALAHYPRMANAHYNLANALSEAGQLKEALAEYRTAIQLQPDFAAAYNNLGNNLAKLGRTDEAIAAFRAALRSNPDEADTHFNLGQALLNEGKSQEAFGEYTEAVRIKPGFVPAQIGLGSALFQMGRLTEAAEHFRQVSHLEPTNGEASYYLGNVLAAGGKLAEAAGFYRQAIQSRPDLVQAHVNLGNMLAQLGHPDEAARCYQDALSRDTNCFTAWNNLGLLVAASNPETAIRFVRLAIQINPDYAEAHFNLGHILAGQKRWSEAGEQYEIVLRTNPDDAIAHYELGCVQVELGRTNDAAAHWRLALQLNPNYRDARDALNKVSATPAP